MAYGSVRELEYQISLANRLGYLVDATELNSLVVETAKVLNGLIRSLRESAKDAR
jgi:four helix bundle protein